MKPHGGARREDPVIREDPVMQAVRELRPPGAAGWSASAEGRETLRGVLRRAHAGEPRKRPSRALVTAGALVAVLAGGGAMATAGGLPWDEPGRVAMCARTLSAEADLAEVATDGEFDPRAPGKACVRQWTRMWGTFEPVPRSFTACFHPGANVPDGNGGHRSDPHAPGGPVIYPADGLGPAEACARIGARPVPLGD
jgi:hypothetical protein